MMGWLLTGAVPLWALGVLYLAPTGRATHDALIAACGLLVLVLWRAIDRRLDRPWPVLASKVGDGRVALWLCRVATDLPTNDPFRKSASPELGSADADAPPRVKKGSELSGLRFLLGAGATLAVLLFAGPYLYPKVEIDNRGGTGRWIVMVSGHTLSVYEDDVDEVRLRAGPHRIVVADARGRTERFEVVAEPGHAHVFSVPGPRCYASQTHAAPPPVRRAGSPTIDASFHHLSGPGRWHVYKGYVGPADCPAKLAFPGRAARRSR